MSKKKPIPTVAERIKKSCPVCGKRAYSREGVHPQCSQTQADAPRKERLAAEKQAQVAERAKGKGEPLPRIWTHF